MDLDQEHAVFLQRYLLGHTMREHAPRLGKQPSKSRGMSGGVVVLPSR
jgi:hypothetical protein